MLVVPILSLTEVAAFQLELPVVLTPRDGSTLAILHDVRSTVGLAVSEDRGLTWSQVGALRTSGHFDVAVSADGDTIHAMGSDRLTGTSYYRAWR